MLPLSHSRKTTATERKSLRVGLAEINDQGRIIWQKSADRHRKRVRPGFITNGLFSSGNSQNRKDWDLGGAFLAALVLWALWMQNWGGDRKAAGCVPPQGLKREGLKEREVPAGWSGDSQKEGTGSMGTSGERWVGPSVMSFERLRERIKFLFVSSISPWRTLLECRVTRWWKSEGGRVVSVSKCF